MSSQRPVSTPPPPPEVENLPTHARILKRLGLHLEHLVVALGKLRVAPEIARGQRWTIAGRALECLQPQTLGGDGSEEAW